MFDMETIGLKISELRKNKDMTQMELADRMNISFQAVSSWERGNSMPDIAKLPELAQIFDVTIDDLLKESSALIRNAANENLEEYLNSNEVSVKELEQAAPILKPKQIKKVISHMQIQSLQEIDDILPFIEKDVLNKLVIRAVEKEDYFGLESIAPFIEQSIVDGIAIKMVSEDKNICEIAPFISQPILIDCVKKIYKKHGLRALEDIAVFLPQEYLVEIAKEEYETYGLRNFEAIAPFLDKKMLSEFIKESY